MQKGLLVCTTRCLDNLDVEFRPKVIADVLSDTQESENEYASMANDAQDVIF